MEPALEVIVKPIVDLLCDSVLNSMLRKISRRAHQRLYCELDAPPKRRVVLFATPSRCCGGPLYNDGRTKHKELVRAERSAVLEFEVGGEVIVDNLLVVAATYMQRCMRSTDRGSRVDFNQITESSRYIELLS